MFYEGARLDRVAVELGVPIAQVHALYESALRSIGRETGVDIGRPMGAAKGSQRRLQEWVAHHRHHLEGHLRAFSSFDAFARASPDWRSPVRERGFAEVRDDLWSVLSLPGPTPQQDGFWPRRGPVWDGVALVPGHQGDGVLLVEAKSHVCELKSGGTRATGTSRSTIEDALAETKAYFGVPHDVSWTGAYYQVANRLAYLYYLRVRRDIPAWLCSIYFVGDSFTSGTGLIAGPATAGQWAPPVQAAKTALGLPAQRRLADFALDLYLPAVPGDERSGPHAEPVQVTDDDVDELKRALKAPRRRA